MKQILTIVTACLMALLAVSCGKGNTPTGVAEKSIECLQKKDFEGYSKLMYYNDSLTGDKLKSEQEAMAAMLQSKYASSLEQKGEITGYRVVSEEVNDSSAVVKMRVAYEKSDSTSESVKLRLNKKGEWRISMGK